MAKLDRKAQNQRITAVTYAGLAEIGMAGTLLAWSASSDAAHAGLFGPVASSVVLAVVMAVVALATVALILGARLGRATLLAAVVVTSVGIACLGVMAVALLIRQLGPGLLLAWSWTLTIPLMLGIRRANSSRRNQGHGS